MPLTRHRRLRAARRERSRHDVGTLNSSVGNNEPTAWLGIWERIAIEGAMLWQTIFAVALLSAGRPRADTVRQQ